MSEKIYTLEDSDGNLTAYRTREAALRAAIKDYATNSIPYWDKELSNVIEMLKVNPDAVKDYHIKRILEGYKMIAGDIINLADFNYIEEAEYINEVPLND